MRLNECFMVRPSRLIIGINKPEIEIATIGVRPVHEAVCYQAADGIIGVRFVIRGDEVFQGPGPNQINAAATGTSSTFTKATSGVVNRSIRRAYAMKKSLTRSFIRYCVVMPRVSAQCRFFANNHVRTASASSTVLHHPNSARPFALRCLRLYRRRSRRCSFERVAVYSSHREKPRR